MYLGVQVKNDYEWSTKYKFQIGVNADLDKSTKSNTVNQPNCCMLFIDLNFRKYKSLRFIKKNTDFSH